MNERQIGAAVLCSGGPQDVVELFHRINLLAPNDCAQFQHPQFGFLGVRGLLGVRKYVLPTSMGCECKKW
jgi:hypothetical protein